MSLEFTKHTNSYHPPLPHYNKIKIALVLGGGGVKGLAHVGVLEELANAGIKPDMIIGCSAGAIIGALYADNPDINHLKAILLGMIRDDLLDISLANLPFGLSSGSALQQFLNTQLHAKTFEELKIPFVVVATNLEFGDLVTFGTGPLEPAIRASAAFPGVFLPIQIEDQYFVDGGVVNAVPVEVAKKLGAEFVIAVDLSGDLPDTLPTHMLGILKRSLEISYNHQSNWAAKKADYVIKVPFKGVDTFDDGINEHVYELGRKAGRAVIDDLRSRLRLKNKLKRKTYW